MIDKGIIEFEEGNPLHDTLHHWLHGDISYSGIEYLDGKGDVRELADGHHAVTLGYTDYGGTELDAIIIRFLSRDHADDPAVFVEKTSYDGKNAVVFGELGDRLAAVVDGDPYEIGGALGMDFDKEMTEYEAELAGEAADDAVSMLERDFGTELGDDERAFTANWIVDNGRFTGGTVDYDFEKLSDAVAEEFGIEPKDDDEEDEGGTVESTQSCAARIVRDKSTGVCSVLMGNGDSLPFNGEDSAMRFCKTHGLHLVNEGVEDAVDGEEPRYPTGDECTAVFVLERCRSIGEKIDSCIALLDKAYPQKDEESVAVKEILGLIRGDAESVAEAVGRGLNG